MSRADTEQRSFPKKCEIGVGKTLRVVICFIFVPIMSKLKKCTKRVGRGLFEQNAFRTALKYHFV